MGKLNKYSIISIIFLFLNLIWVDFVYVANIPSDEFFDPIIGNWDYLRHHSIARQLAEGNNGFFSIYDNSLNSMPYIYGQPIPTLMYSGLIWISNDNHIFTFFFSLIFFSLISWIVLSLIINRIIKNKNNSFLISSIILISGNFLFSFWYLIPNKIVIQIDSIIMLHRIANPLLSYPFLFLFIYFLLLYFEKINVNKRVLFYYESLLLGLLFGILLLSYFYFWTFAFVSYFLIEFYFFIFRKESFLRQIYHNLFFLLSSLPFVLIFLYNSYLQNSIPFYKDYLIRNGVIFTRNFFTSGYELFYIFLFFLFLFLFYYVSKNRLMGEGHIFFMKILVLSSYICLYNHLITGMAIQRGHWFSFLTYILFLFLFFVFILDMVKKVSFLNLSKFNLKNFYLFLLIIISFINLLVLSYIGNSQYDNFSISRDKLDLFSYLNNKKFSGLVLANEKISREVVGFTDKDTVFVDIIEKVPDDIQNDRMMAFENFLLSCSIEFDVFFVISENEILCENLIFEKKIGSFYLYRY